MKYIKETDKEDFNDNETDCEESKPYDFDNLKNDFKDFKKSSIWFKLSFFVIIGIAMYTVGYLTLLFAGSSGSTISLIVGFILALFVVGGGVVVAVMILTPILPLILIIVIAITSAISTLYHKINPEIK